TCLGHGQHFWKENISHMAWGPKASLRRADLDIWQRASELQSHPLAERMTPGSLDGSSWACVAARSRPHGLLSSPALRPGESSQLDCSGPADEGPEPVETESDTQGTP
ncbi:hypothetical protein STEG23_024833, partial [Scotinomys teguina]